jgi:hypothetical protein
MPIDMAGKDDPDGIAEDQPWRPGAQNLEFDCAALGMRSQGSERCENDRRG